MNFKIRSDFKPAGSQPRAIAELSSGFTGPGVRQTLLGVTGSGKTFTAAHIIENLQLPCLVMAHNKTLAAQLYHEFRDLFPHNRVEYFVSYYDYYQPESYIPQKDQYIEKDSSINEKIEQMRLSATASLLSRKDTIVVASVSCIFSVGNPDFYANLSFEISENQQIRRRDLLARLIKMQYERNDLELQPGRFRARGDTIDIVPANASSIIRIEMYGDTVERIREMDRHNQRIIDELKYFHLFPARHYVTPDTEIRRSVMEMRAELEKWLPSLDPMEAHRLKKRTEYDIEMIEETGFCKGIENYSRFFDRRKPGEKPFCLLDYYPEDFLLIIDESHQTLPQIKAMYKGDFARKKNLVEYGFRLPSAFDNRPLRFAEVEAYLEKCRTLFVSATPGPYESACSTHTAEQIIRPTGLLDPPVSIRPISGQMDDLKKEIGITLDQGNRVLVTTLTKRLAEELTEHLAENKISTRYLHSEIDTLERSEIIQSLRRGEFDVLVGINLLREGLDIPEVGFIAIMDADKEGFLRDARSLIQIIGRAARNSRSRVILYADIMTDSMRTAVTETRRRRNIQSEYNRLHRITPQTIRKPVKEKSPVLSDIRHIPAADVPKLIRKVEQEMHAAAEKLDFEAAIKLRDYLKLLTEKNSPAAAAAGDRTAKKEPE